VRYKNGLYYVRIDDRRAEYPVVQVFSVAVVGVPGTPELYEKLNEMNTLLNCSKTFWVKDEILFESAIPGDALSLEGFESACDDVGGAANYFCTRLASDFGGLTTFVDEQGPDYKPPGPGSRGYL
jgi:hypothetical protein